MRLRSFVLPALLATPLVLPMDGALACIRFKKPGGAVPPGLREPSDPPPPPPSTPPPTTPPPSGPTVGPVTPPAAPPSPTTGADNDGPAKKKQADDDSTWETWWALNRIEFFPHRYVSAVVSQEGPQMRGAKPLDPKVVREKLWKPLLVLKDDKQAFIREAALITIGRIASDEGLREEARTILLEAVKDENKLVARAAALGLFYVADETSILPMVKLAENAKTPEDVRAFLAITLTAIGSEVAPLLMKMVSSERSADFELVSAALMALGYTPGPESQRFLADVYGNKKYRAELRAMAVESFGRRGNVAEGEKILTGALDDREVDIRRSAAIALGVLDYRTENERKMAAELDKWDTSNGAPIPADVLARVEELKKGVPSQRKEMERPTREIVKRLVHALEADSDNFVSGMAALALGRIAAQTGDPTVAVRRLVLDLKKERNIVREYEILALAIAKAPEAFEIARDAIEGKNKQATTQAAGMIALGILGDERGNDVLRAQVEDGQHPVLRGYAAMALGMLGHDKSQKPIMALVKTTKSPDGISFGALGLALLGKKQGSDVLIRRLTETGNGDVAAFCVYSLGLMKDRSKLNDLLEIAQKHDSFFVQSAAVAAIGYISSAEDYPRRHLMARGFNYRLNLPLLENFFYKL
jgi:HEAT repeat protein